MIEIIVAVTVIMIILKVTMIILKVTKIKVILKITMMIITKSINTINNSKSNTS